MSWNYVSSRCWEQCPKCNYEKCKHCQKRVWSQRHECGTKECPNNAVGFSHAYRYCAMYKKRVSEIKKCGGKT